MNARLQDYLRNARRFFINILGDNVESIDLNGHPVLLTSEYIYRTDGTVRPFGNQYIIENYTVILISLTPEYPLFSTLSKFNLIITPDFETKKQHIANMISAWISSYSQPTENVEEYLQEKLDEELDKLFLAIQNNNQVEILKSKEKLEHYREIREIIKK